MEEQYSLSVVQLCPDAYKAQAEALANSLGYAGENLTIKLKDAGGTIWWGCHAWWIPSVFTQVMESTDPTVVGVMSHVINSVSPSPSEPSYATPSDHWQAALSANGLTLF